MDSVLKAGVSKVSDLDGSYLAKRDSILRANVMEESHFQITGESARNLPIEGVHFFVPVKGVISDAFDKSSRPGIDITSAEGSMVTAVLDGTVVHTSWDSEEGYLIVVQHAGDILSIYKHNQKLLRAPSDVVKAGTPIGLVAESASLTKGNHLHFELWYEGQPMDPTQFINF
jgi:murein DD-endopeptidase MepM/ murein hydrolase activator NlpD